MAKFKVGDKVRVIQGVYPEHYDMFRMPVKDEMLGQEGVILKADSHYERCVPDYQVQTIDTSGWVDEPNLELVGDDQEKERTPDLLVQALTLLESINAKLESLDARLAAHEAKANAVITINVDGAVQVAEKVVAQHLSNACQEVSLPESDSEGWLYEFDEWMQVPIGTKVEVEFPNGDTRTFTITDNHYNFAGEQPMALGDNKPLELDDLWSSSRDMKALRVIR